MKRRLLASFGILSFVLAGLAAGCSRSETPSAPQASPAPQAAATRAPQAAAPSAQAPEELYVDLEAEPDEGAPPLTVKFTSSVEDGTPPFTYKWDFGDGTPAGTEANPTHVYAKEGEFTATLTAIDSKGITGSEEVDILVEPEE